MTAGKRIPVSEPVRTSLTDMKKPVQTDDGSFVSGYFTLVNDTIFHEHGEEDERPSFFIHTRYPAIKIARLATSQKYEGRGIKENMVKVGIKLALTISEISGCSILSVDAKPKAVGFYKKYGFRKVLRNFDDITPRYRDFHTDYQ